MSLHDVIVSVLGLAVIVLNGCSEYAPSDGGPSVSEIGKALKLWLWRTVMSVHRTDQPERLSG